MRRILMLSIISFVWGCTKETNIEESLVVTIGGDVVVYNSPMFYIDSSNYISYIRLNQYCFVHNNSNDTINLDSVIANLKIKDSIINMSSENCKLRVLPKDSILINLTTGTLFSVLYNPLNIQKDIYDKIQGKLKNSSTFLSFSYYQKEHKMIFGATILRNGNYVFSEKKITNGSN